MELSEIIGVDAVRAPLKATSKKRLLQDLADMAEQVYRLPVGHGLQGADGPRGAGPDRASGAASRSRTRASPGCSQVIGLFVRLEKPVDFEVIDRQPVDLVFALFAPEAAGAEHLKALARVSRTLRSEAVCAKLRSTFDPSALYAILTDGKAEQAA